MPLVFLSATSIMSVSTHFVAQEIVDVVEMRFREINGKVQKPPLIILEWGTEMAQTLYFPI